jgi:glycine cleavage system aminomethyltransferase T
MDGVRVVLMVPQTPTLGQDDTVITNGAEWLYVVVNAGCADKDLAHIQEHLARFKASGKEVDLEILSPDYSLVALQGTILLAYPKALAWPAEAVALLTLSDSMQDLRLRRW